MSRRANSRKCRVYFCRPDNAHRDGTGWLGRQDSNLGMAESKSLASPGQKIDRNSPFVERELHVPHEIVQVLDKASRLIQSD